MVNIPLFPGVYTSQVMQDFFHQQYYCLRVKISCNELRSSLSTCSIFQQKSPIYHDLTHKPIQNLQISKAFGGQPLTQNSQLVDFNWHIDSNVLFKKIFTFKGLSFGKHVGMSVFRRCGGPIFSGIWRCCKS